MVKIDHNSLGQLRSNPINRTGPNVAYMRHCLDRESLDCSIAMAIWYQMTSDRSNESHFQELWGGETQWFAPLCVAACQWREVAALDTE